MRSISIGKGKIAAEFFGLITRRRPFHGQHRAISLCPYRALNWRLRRIVFEGSMRDMLLVAPCLRSWRNDSVKNGERCCLDWSALRGRLTKWCEAPNTTREGACAPQYLREALMLPKPESF